jgi:pyrroline-5-carboxylate reductase
VTIIESNFKPFIIPEIMKPKSIGFIGGGRITKIFLQAFNNKQIQFNSVFVYDTNAEVLSALKNIFPFIKTDSLEQISRAGHSLYCSASPGHYGNSGKDKN